MFVVFISSIYAYDSTCGLYSPIDTPSCVPDEYFFYDDCNKDYEGGGWGTANTSQEWSSTDSTIETCLDSIGNCCYGGQQSGNDVGINFGQAMTTNFTCSVDFMPFTINGGHLSYLNDGQKNNFIYIFDTNAPAGMKHYDGGAYNNWYSGTPSLSGTEYHLMFWVDVANSYTNMSLFNKTSGEQLASNADDLFSNDAFDGFSFYAYSSHIYYRNWRCWNGSWTDMPTGEAPVPPPYIPDYDNCTDYSFIYLNISFKNETNDALISAYGDIALNLTYNGSYYIDNSYDFDSTQNFYICSNDSTYNWSGEYTIIYSNLPDYPQRSFTDDAVLLTNDTFDQDLYLLFVAQSFYIRFRTVNQYDVTLSDVLATMYKDGDEIESYYTDDSGLATFVVNPDQDYTFVFSKTGYNTVSYTIRPTSTDLYTVTMVSQTSTQNITTSAGSSYFFQPFMDALTNKTSYLFSFNLTSQQYDINDCDLYIRDNNSDIIASVAGTFNTTYCMAGITLNTWNNVSLTVQATYVLGAESYTLYRPYIITSYTVSPYSFKTLIDDLSAFSGAGFGASGRFLLAFIIILSLLIWARIKGDSLITQDSLIFFFWALIGFFSYIGWLYLDLPSIPTILGFDLKKYIIFILMSIISFAFIIRRNL